MKSSHNGSRVPFKSVGMIFFGSNGTIRPNMGYKPKETFLYRKYTNKLELEKNHQPHSNLIQKIHKSITKLKKHLKNINKIYQKKETLKNSKNK